jgi:hypothetical protein
MGSSRGWRKHLDDRQSESPSSYSTLIYENAIPSLTVQWEKLPTKSYSDILILQKKKKHFFSQEKIKRTISIHVICFLLAAALL